MNRHTPKARTIDAVRRARAAAGMPTSTVAAASGLSDLELRKRLRSLPARGRCAATIAALAAAQRLPDTPHSAAAAHRACPPPAVRAAWLDDLDAVAAVRGSASWALAHQPFRGITMEMYPFTYTGRMHRSVIVALATTVRDNSLYRLGVAHNQLCPAAILERLAHDEDDRVRGVAAHTQRRCCCDEPSGRTCKAAAEPQRRLEAVYRCLDDQREDYERFVSLRDM